MSLEFRAYSGERFVVDKMPAHRDESRFHDESDSDVTHSVPDHMGVIIKVKSGLTVAGRCGQ